MFADPHLTFWHWWGLAGILLALEVTAPGVFFLWVAIGAVVAGFVVLAVPDMAWETASIIMIVVAIVTALIGRRFYPRHKVDESTETLNRRTAALVGRVVTLEQPIVDGSGRAQMDGSHWTVNGPDAPAGSRVRVVGHEGTILKVMPDESPT
jgi:hypothetical protein